MEKFDSKIYEKDTYEEPIYSSWLKNVNERVILEKALFDRFNEWFSESWKEKKICIVDIGCGVGSATIKLFKILDKKGIEYCYLGIDPYKEQLERFEESIPLGTNKKLLCSTLENFKPTKKYDIAFVIHTLYYVENMENSLTKILNFAKKAIIVHHGKHGINEVHQKFKKYIKEGAYIISTHEDILDSLDQLGIKYNSKLYPATLNIAPCKDPKNQDGRNMIKFFLEKSILSDEVIEEVSKWFRNKKSNTMTHDFALIITKRQE